MRARSLLLLLSFVTVSGLTASCAGIPVNKEGTRAPIITHAFAVQEGYYGSIWKIYIEAEDPDGDMYRIASVVNQVGYTRYPVDWVNIKSQDARHFKGYLQWNTFSSKASYLKEWTEITLRVSVVDRAGNWSNEVAFPFTFVSGAAQKYTLPPPFDQGKNEKLGNIMIDLVEPGADAAAGGSDRY